MTISTTPTCTHIVSGPGEPIQVCGNAARHAVYTTSRVTGDERVDTYVCSEEHLATTLRMIALYEVCDFRVKRYI